MQNNNSRLGRKHLRNLRNRRIKRKRRLRLTLKGKLLIIVPMVILLLYISLVTKFYLFEGSYVVSNEAKITADILKVSPEIKGEIAEVNVKVGDVVGAGEVLFSLEADKIKNQVDEAYAQQETALAELEKETNRLRASKGLANNSLTNKGKKRTNLNINNNELKNYEILQNNVKTAQAKYNLAKLALQSTNVQAPGKGTVVESNVHIGDSASPEHYVMTIIDLSRLRVTAYIKPNEIKKIKKGQRVELNIEDISTRTIYGSVSGIGVATEAIYNLLEGDKLPLNKSNINKNIPVTIDFNFSGKQIFPGMDVKVKIKVRG
jgi:membrane fusion protein (multidrug efflux system)